MRQIKFRAYHNSLKKMLIPEKLWLDDGRITAFTAQGEPENVFQVRRDSEDYGLELMQSTGLFDKNGKEIYEGDIIRMSLDGLRTFVCIYEKGGFQFQDLVYSMRSYAGVYITHYIEIIGNIHEKPEMINQ